MRERDDEVDNDDEKHSTSSAHWLLNLVENQHRCTANGIFPAESSTSMSTLVLVSMISCAHDYAVNRSSSRLSALAAGKWVPLDLEDFFGESNHC